ncbi:MAG: Glycerol operon regulatory protein [Stenotrophomonas maltophilia]|nr:MAG: Glycerol operon regulatory protein [Stenotrophomonas maltophilia]
MQRTTRTIQSLERAMLLLETLSACGGRARLAEVAERSGLTKSTAHGLLDTLVGMGYVVRAGNDYALGLRLQTLVRPLRDEDERLRAAFLPALRAFTELCGEHCVLAVPAGTRAYFTLDALAADGRPLALPLDERRDALTTSAVGKVFLAHDRALVRRLRRSDALPVELEPELQHVNARGYALDLQTSQPELNCIALPLRVRGRVVAALGAGGPAERFAQPYMRRLATRAMRELFDLVAL